MVHTSIAYMDGTIKCDIAGSVTCIDMVNKVESGETREESLRRRRECDRLQRETSQSLLYSYCNSDIHIDWLDAGSIGVLL